jgi:DUF2924 family protein
VDLSEQLAKLHNLDKAALRAQWLALFHQPVPKVRKELLFRMLAYRIQERAHGGLGAATRSRLRHLARLFEKEPTAAIPNIPALKPGTRLLRQWQEQMHVVTILEDSFEYRGSRYASLSQIARLITGTRWSGPLFFGLKSSQALTSRGLDEP